MKELRLAEATWRVDETVVRAPVQIIGSYNPRSEMFIWAWDHPSVAPRLRVSAERTRWFGNAHKVTELTERQVKMSEADAWRLTAIAMKVNAAYGAYRGPTGGPIVFMTLGVPSVLEEPA
jgi:hypothetical protein